MTAMKPYDFVHLLLHATGGRLQGRTKLQKMAYFVGILTGMLDELGYRPHFYGPYSPWLAGAVDELRSVGFLEQRVAGGGSIDPRGFELSRYDYLLTEDGKQIAEDKAATHPLVWKKIKTAVDRLQDVGIGDYMKLSIAAKAYFLVGKSDKPVKVPDLVKMSERFGWKVTPDQVAEAAEWLKSLGLVEEQAAF